MRRGFTMIEMLTVIAIIAILAGILFPVFATVKRNTYKAQCINNMHSMLQGLKLYKDDHGTYPEALYGFWIPNGTGNVDPNSTLTVAGLYPQYVKTQQEFRCPLSPFNMNSTATLNGVPPTPGSFRQYAPRSYPAWDSYDGQLEPPKLGLGQYIVKYVRHWSNQTPGFSDYPRQLLYKNPPEDTVVTWCTYHREYGPDGVPNTGSVDIVGFLDGHVGTIPSNKMFPIASGGVVPPDHSYLVNRGN
jgi:prepilin-type N-terminal cleavage/methylation domain-containing protein